MALLYAVAHFFFNRYVPWTMHVDVVRNLFMVDPSKGKKPKAAAKMAEKENKTIFKEARESLLNRIKITASVCDNILLFLEALI